jgi:hypothetical protein
LRVERELTGLRQHDQRLAVRPTILLRTVQTKRKAKSAR